jgi:hypothetical protein
MRRFTVCPWTLKTLFTRVESESLTDGMNDQDISNKLGIPLWNIYKDYKRGRLQPNDKIVLCRGSTKLREYPYDQMIPEDGKVHVWGHGYRAGLPACWVDGRAVGPGRLQTVTDEDGYTEEDVETTVEEFGRFLGDQVGKIKSIQFYSCVSGGRMLANATMYSYSFVDYFQYHARQNWSWWDGDEHRNVNAYISGVAGSFTKRFTDQEWATTPGTATARDSLKYAYYSVFEYEDLKNKRLELAAAMTGRKSGQPAPVDVGDATLLTRYLAKLDDHYAGKRQPALSEAERILLTNLYNEQNMTVALHMPHGFLLTVD